MLGRRSLLRWHPRRVHRTRTNAHPFSKKPPHTSLQSDELGLPLSPPWSVYALINSYPSPTLSDATLTRLHDLAALVPPAENTPEFRELKKEMEDLVRLVEAVRTAPHEVEARESEGPPDGRVWPQGRGVAFTDHATALAQQSELVESLPSGRELLKHAQRAKHGYYLVDNSKTKT